MAEAHREEIAKLEALYASNPGGRVFVHLAEALRKAGEQARARSILEEGLARHPDSASGYVVLGRVQLDLGDALEAGASFRRVLELDAGNLVALRNLGDLARRDGRAREAVEHYRELLARSPSNDEVRELVEALEVTLQAEAQRPAAAAEASKPEDVLTPHAAAPGDTGAAAFVEPEFGVVEIDDLPGDLASFAGLREDTPEAAEDVADFDLGELALGGTEFDDDVAGMFDAEPAVVDASFDAFPALGDDPPVEPLDVLTLDVEQDLSAADDADAGLDEAAPLELPAFEEPDWAEELPPAPGDHLETETMADLYASQGLHDRAADVYRALLRRRPGDTELEAKLQAATRSAEAAAAASYEDEGGDFDVALDGQDFAGTAEATPAEPELPRDEPQQDEPWTPAEPEVSPLAAGIAPDAPWQDAAAYPMASPEPAYAEAPAEEAAEPAPEPEPVQPAPAAEDESSEAWLRGKGSVWAEPPAADEPDAAFAWSGSTGEPTAPSGEEPAQEGPPIGEYLQGLLSWKRQAPAAPPSPVTEPSAPTTEPWTPEEAAPAAAVPTPTPAAEPWMPDEPASPPAAGGLRDAPDFMPAEPWLSGPADASSTDEAEELILDREEPAPWDSPVEAASAPEPVVSQPAEPPADPWASADPWAAPAAPAPAPPQAAPDPSPPRRRNVDPVEDAFNEWYGDATPSAAPPVAPASAASAMPAASPPAAPMPAAPAAAAPVMPAPAASTPPPAPAAPQGGAEAAGEDDEDLAMFRSWLQSLKK